MKKIVTGMGNDVLNLELKKYSKYDVLMDDAFCQDIFITNLRKAKSVDVVIISGLLQGQWSLEEFVDKIRKSNNACRIIVVTDEIDLTGRKLLEDYNVLDIFIDATVEIKDIIEAIDREETIKKKYEMISETSSEYNTSSNVVDSKPKGNNLILEKIVQKQEIIAVSGTNGSGKSTFAVNFSKVLSQKSDAKILLIDLDTLSGFIDNIINISRVPSGIELVIDEDKKSGINYATELILKNRFDSNVFDELVIDAGGFDVLTGNTSLHYCQNILNTECYDKILKCAKEKYDFIIIDTSSNIFLDSTKWALTESSRIFFITESNKVSLSKAEQFINTMVNNWGIWKGKMQIVVNKKAKNQYENDVISHVIEGIDVIGEIKVNEENNMSSYEKILEEINYIPKKSIIEKLLGLKKEIFYKDSMNERGVVHAN